jgi:hypothetical protein
MKKKTVFLMLAFIMMSAASVDAQVRIGGNADPNESAVLDLNATDDVTATGSLGLALPRVKLNATTNPYPLKAHVQGMMVYNTESAGDVVRGAYYNDGKKWVMTRHATLVGTDGGGLIVINPTAIDEPDTVAIKAEGVTEPKIATGAVTLAKMAINSVDATKIVDKSVGSAAIANGAVITATIRDANVTLAKLAPNSVNSAIIANSSIATVDLANGAVTAVKLNAMGAETDQALVYNGSAWTPTALTASAYSRSSAPCNGAIVYGGAYNGLSNPKYVDGNFESNWSDSTFSIQGKDLCWAIADISGKKIWEDAKTACAALNTDNRLWRLPNLKELQVLYEAIGGRGGSTTALTALDTYGYGVSKGASAMQSDPYWTSTNSLQPNLAYYFNFSNGNRGYANITPTTYYVRCVRSL